MNNSSFKKIAYLVLIILGVIIGLFVSFRLAVFFAPFLIAYLVASLMEPAIRFLVARFKVPRRLAAFIILLIVLGAFGTLIFFMISKLIVEVRELSVLLPTYISQVYQDILIIINRATDLYNELPQDVIGNIQGITSHLPNKLNLDSILGDLSKPVGRVLKGISGIPQGLVIVIVTILSTYFLASDREKISGAIKSQLPEAWVVKFIEIKNDMFFAFFWLFKGNVHTVVNYLYRTKYRFFPL